MVLRVAPRREIEEDPALALLEFSLARELQAKLRLADARGTENYCERAGNQSASQHGVEPGYARSQPLRRRR